MRITPAAAISDRNLLGSAFAGSSWDLWKICLKAAYGKPLTKVERRRFHSVAERDPPTRQVRELHSIVGRRGGKDSIASACAIVAGIGDYRQYLRPGEKATVVCVAVDRTQAKIVLRYIVAHFRENPLLRPLVEREVADGVELKNGVEIIVATNSFRAIRGRTIICAIFDEVAYWRDESSANPDEEVYHAVLPGLVTLPGAMLITISSPYRRAGLLYRKWRESYGKNDDHVLVVKGPSRAFNPLLPQEIIDQALERDPEAARAEWLARMALRSCRFRRSRGGRGRCGARQVRAAVRHGNAVCCVLRSKRRQF
jgi:hypothetical protein